MSDKICPVCNQKMRGKYKLSDGVVCIPCLQMSPDLNITVRKLKSLYTVMPERARKFRETRSLKNVLTKRIAIDDNNRLFYIEDKQLVQQRIYSFDEVVGYEIEEVGGKIVTKKKHGIGRAVAGTFIAGPVGGMIGATTATETSEKVGTVNHFYLKLHICDSDYRFLVLNPPAEFPVFLDECIEEQKDEAPQTAPIQNAADEILKYKQLLDCGAITQEEFEIKKKQLLGL